MEGQEGGLIEIRTDAARKCISDEKADSAESFYCEYPSSYETLPRISDLHRIINYGYRVYVRDAVAFRSLDRSRFFSINLDFT